MLDKVAMILAAGLWCCAGPAFAEEPDWSEYRTVLAQVKPGTKNGINLMLVDYPAIKANGSLDKAYYGSGHRLIINWPSRSTMRL